MPADSDFVDYVLDCMTGIGPVRPVRFFGGMGLTLDGVQFAYVTGSNRLFFVVDDVTRPRYQAAGMEPFSYMRGSARRVIERWYELPEDVLMDDDELRRWVRDAVATAARSRTAKLMSKRKSAGKTKMKGKGRGDGKKKAAKAETVEGQPEKCKPPPGKAAVKTASALRSASQPALQRRRSPRARA